MRVLSPQIYVESTAWAERRAEHASSQRANPPPSSAALQVEVLGCDNAPTLSQATLPAIPHVATSRFLDVHATAWLTTQSYKSRSTSEYHRDIIE